MNGTPFLDPLIKELTDKIAAYLNRAGNGTVIVRRVAYYDAFNIPMSDYPLLKGFRESDYFDLSTASRQSDIKLTHALANVAMEQLPGINNFLALNIVNALREVSIEKAGCIEFTGRVNSRYRPMFQLGELIYQADFSFNIKENG